MWEEAIGNRKQKIRKGKKELHEEKKRLQNEIVSKNNEIYIMKQNLRHITRICWKIIIFYIIKTSFWAIKLRIWKPVALSKT